MCVCVQSHLHGRAHAGPALPDDGAAHALAVERDGAELPVLQRGHLVVHLRGEFNCVEGGLWVGLGQP